MIRILFVFAAIRVFAGNEWNNDKLFVAQECVFVISSFAEVDYFTTFSQSGDFLWEIPFSSQIQSWKIEDNRLYILSQTRNKLAYYLSCVSPIDGKMAWEKGIYSP